MSQLNLKQQIENYENGIYGPDDFCTFYDWFCRDSSLEGKAKNLFSKVKTFLKHFPEIDLEKHYVFFKNNCPMYGSLYDDFRICNLEHGKVIFTVVPRSGHYSTHENQRAGIHGRPDLNPHGEFIHEWKLGKNLQSIYREMKEEK